MTWRRFGVLLRGLPATSLLQTLLRDTVEFDEPEPGTPARFGPWSTEAYLLASLIDSVRDNTRVLAQVNSENRVDMPEPTPRPQTKIRARTVQPSAVAYLQAIRDRHRRESE